MIRYFTLVGFEKSMSLGVKKGSDAERALLEYARTGKPYGTSLRLKNGNVPVDTHAVVVEITKEEYEQHLRKVQEELQERQ